MEMIYPNPPANAGDISHVGLIPGSGRFPGGGHGNPLQYSCLENPMGREAWRAAVHRISKESDTTEATQHTRTITGYKFQSIVKYTAILRVRKKMVN